MRFSIMGFNQEKLLKEYPKLNCNDVVVLRSLLDLISNMEIKVKEDNKEYSWVMYKLLLEDLPFITQSESTIKKIVQKLIDAGLIERIVVNRGGKYTYFRKTEKCSELEYKKKVTPSKETKELDDINQYKVNKASNVISEKITKKTISLIVKANSIVLHKAVGICEGKEFVTNTYFQNALKIASQQVKNFNNNQIEDKHLESKEYYENLERQLLGWD